MNEEKNRTIVSEQKVDATSLSVQIQAFIRNNKQIKPDDWILLNRLIKQLGKQGYCESHKVLRSMQNRFDVVRRKYQRG